MIKWPAHIMLQSIWHIFIHNIAMLVFLLVNRTRLWEREWIMDGSYRVPHAMITAKRSDNGSPITMQHLVVDRVVAAFLH